MQINPFCSDIVKKPREIEVPVPGLNDSQLSEIVDEFEVLLNDDEKRLDHSVFVVSSQAGYGKSHLLGRLFGELNTRATLLYVLPFQDPDSCWKSILLRAVQELKFPDRVSDSKAERSGPSQLETIAHGIVVDLTIKAIQNSPKDANPERIATALQCQSVEGLRASGQYVKMKRHVPRMASILRSLNIQLNSSIESWMNVRFILAYEPESALFQGCEDLLKGGSIDLDEAKRIGIRRNNLICYDASALEMNDNCRKRLEDLCGLMRPVRPFVFCFDETERYLSRPLGETFVLVIQMLTKDFSNHMTVVTANLNPWQKIEANWEEAQMNCLGPPIQLSSINQEHGEKLIEDRLSYWGFQRGELDKMLSGGWLNDLFLEHGNSALFEKMCQTMERPRCQSSSRRSEKPLCDYGGENQIGKAQTGFRQGRLALARGGGRSRVGRLGGRASQGAKAIFGGSMEKRRHDTVFRVRGRLSLEAMASHSAGRQETFPQYRQGAKRIFQNVRA